MHSASLMPSFPGAPSSSSVLLWHLGQASRPLLTRSREEWPGPLRGCPRWDLPISCSPCPGRTPLVSAHPVPVPLCPCPGPAVLRGVRAGSFPLCRALPAHSAGMSLPWEQQGGGVSQPASGVPAVAVALPALPQLALALPNPGRCQFCPQGHRQPRDVFQQRWPKTDPAQLRIHPDQPRGDRNLLGVSLTRGHGDQAVPGPRGPSGQRELQPGTNLGRFCRFIPPLNPLQTTKPFHRGGGKYQLQLQ